MTEWVSQQWMPALAGFFVGIVLTVIAVRRSDASGDAYKERITRQINNLSAENKVLSQKNDSLRERLGEFEEALRERDDALKSLESALEARTDQFEHTRTDLKEAVSKIRDLRKVLVEKAEDTIRAEVHARDVEHELDLLQNSGDLLDAELLQTRKTST